MPDVSNMPNTFATHSGIIVKRGLRPNGARTLTFEDGLTFAYGYGSGGSDLVSVRAGAHVTITINGRGNIVAIEEAK